MRKVIFKLLFYLVIAAWVWAFFLYPPKWLMSLSLLAYVIINVLWGLLCVYFYSIQKTLTSFSPEEMEINPLSGEAPIEELCEFSGFLTSLGFVTVGPPYTIGKLPSVSMTFVHEQSNTYATITDFKHHLMKKTLLNFVSHLKDYRGGLGTFSDSKQTDLPGAPGSLYQVFQDAAPKTLFERHLQALAYLKNKGIEACPAKPDTFLTDWRAGGERRCNYINAAIFRVSLILLWRVIMRKAPHEGPIEYQKTARKQIAYLQYSQ